MFASGVILLSACSSGKSDEVVLSGLSPTAGSGTNTEVEASQNPLDTSFFADINPEPKIRGIDYSIDLGFNYVDAERDRIPRDAIQPIYSPVFVPADATQLMAEELVLGLEINGDARAYPVGMMRVREMVNDVVGGTPVLVTW
jgi:hypothetical protein